MRTSTMSYEGVLKGKSSISASVASAWSRLMSGLDAERRFLLALLSLTFTLGVTYAVITPPSTGPDEDAHYEYVQSLWDSGGTKITGNAYYHQPAYYLLETPVFALTRSQPKEIQYVAMRLVSVGLLLGQVVLAYMSAKLLSPRSPVVYLGTTAVVALLPGRVWIGAMINDDNLVSLSSSVFIYFSLRAALRGFKSRSMLGAAVFAVATVLSKRTALPAIAASALVLLMPFFLKQWRSGYQRRRVVVIATVLGVGIIGVLLLSFVLPGLGAHVSALFAAILSAMDVATYGRVHWALRYWQRFLSAQPLMELSTLQFKSFWLPIWRDDYLPPDSAYLLPLALSVIAGAGLLLRLLFGAISWMRGLVDAKQVLAMGVLLAILVGVWAATAEVYLEATVSAGSAAANRTVAWSAHARYLFLALVPFAYFIVLGVEQFIPSRRVQWLALAVLVAILLYLVGVSVSSLFSSYYWWGV